MTEATFIFRIDGGLKTQLSKTAEYEAWFKHQVQAGLDSANTGHLISAEVVEAEFAARRDASRRK